MNRFTLIAEVQPHELGPLPTRVDFTAGTIARILQITFGVAGAIAVLIITFAALMYVTSQGNPQSTQKARNAIIDALIGLVICITAFGIVTFVVSKL